VPLTLADLVVSRDRALEAAQELLRKKIAATSPPRSQVPSGS
jgi:hypothetical protein